MLRSGKEILPVFFFCLEFIKFGTGYAYEALLNDFDFRENRLSACSNFLEERKLISARTCNVCPIWS